MSASATSFVALLSLVAISISSGVRAEESDGAAAPELASTLEAMEIGGVDIQTATLMLSGQEGGDVNGALLWTVDGTDTEGRTHIVYVVEADGAQLISGIVDRRIAIAFLSYLIDESGRIIDHSAQGVVLDTDHYGDLLRGGGIRFVGRTALDASSASLRVMVREQTTRHFFLTRSRIDLEAARDDDSRPPPPVFRGEAEGWIIVHQNGVPDEFDLGFPNPCLPAALPVLVAGSPSEFLVGLREASSTADIEASIVDGAGRIVAQYSIDSESPVSQSTWLRTATLPAMDLPPGRYQLVLSTRRADGTGEATRRSTPIVLVSADAPRTWIIPPGAPPTRHAGDKNVQRSGRFRRKVVRSSYLEALADLASGDDIAARQRVIGLEEGAISSDALRSLRRIEDGVATELAEMEPQSLIPIALLHQQLVRRYVARRQFVLAAHSRAVAADRAVRIGEAAVGEGFAPALLVDLASDLSRTASTSQAREYLEQALLLDPRFRPAILALGASFERKAEYDRAVATFREMIELDPDNREAELRLAVNLVRTGQVSAAADLFRDLIDDGQNDWIEIVAVQELARRLVAKNSKNQALELLERSARHSPNDQRLPVLRSWILDSTGQSLAAVAALLSIPPAQEGDSPRLRYGEWPDLGSEVSSTSIRARAEKTLPDLASALQALEVPR